MGLAKTFFFCADYDERRRREGAGAVLYNIWMKILPND
jgi:hypothetical protein